MSDPIFKYGKWICPIEFKDEKPIDLFHKQLDRRSYELPEQLQHYHMLVKKSFTIAEIDNKYSIRITADDYYKLYINGKYVCQGPSQGYYFCYYWNEVDISQYLVQGENEIYVDVYYQGLINRAYNSGDRRMGMIAEIYRDDEYIIGTDDSWVYEKSSAYEITHIIGLNTMFAENVDSRWIPQSWQPCVEKEVDYTFHKSPVKILQVYGINPKTQEILDSGAIFYDFGQEITASLRIRATGTYGAKVRILCGEEADDSPEKVRFKMRSNSLCDEWWTLDDGENVLEQYDYRAFRYVTLVPENGVEIVSCEAIVRHYPFDDEYCELETQDEVLKAVWDICKNGIKYGSQEVYVDCPMREKGQYAGDLTISSSAHIILTGDLSLFEKAIDNQMQSTFICKGLMAVTPGSLMQEIADYSLQFPILALRHYHYTGDKEYLRKCYDVCDGIIAHFRQFEREDGLLEDVTDKWNLVDWPKNLRDDYDFPMDGEMTKGSGVHNVVNAFYIGCVMQTEEIAKILGIEREMKSIALKEAFHNVFFNDNTGLYTDSPNTEHSAIHSNVIAVFYGIHRPEEEETICNLIMSKGLCCGVYMSYFVLKALCRMKKYKEAFSLIVSKGEHSWYNMVREGATTCFEAWGKDQKKNASLCHPWASAPISVLAEDILPQMPEVGRIVRKKEES